MNKPAGEKTKQKKLLFVQKLAENFRRASVTLLESKTCTLDTCNHQVSNPVFSATPPATRHLQVSMNTQSKVSKEEVSERSNRIHNSNKFTAEGGGKKVGTRK